MRMSVVFTGSRCSLDTSLTVGVGPVDPALLFSIAGNVALPGWLLLALLPRWKYSATLIAPVVIPGALAVVYAVLVLGGFGSGGANFGDFGSLEGVKGLFQQDQLLLAGWIHYLAFDLFIGSWEVRDAQRNGIPHLLVVPCLFFTLMLGPVGLLAYLLLRGGLRRQWTISPPQQS